MRISDWSSCVCSSDLPEQPRLGVERRTPTVPSGALAISSRIRSVAFGVTFRAAGRARVVVLLSEFPVRVPLRRTSYAGPRVGPPPVYPDRKGVSEGKSVSARVDRGGRGKIKKKTIV